MNLSRKAQIFTSPKHTPYFGGSLDARYPGIFLAGPIQGADDWQSRAVTELADLADYHEVHCNVYNPRRAAAYLPSEEFKDEDYYTQANWERANIAASIKDGVMLFWLEDEFFPKPGRSYAQTTRFELGEAFGLARTNPELKVVVGIDKNFTGARYIRHVFQQNLPKVPIATTLAETCKHAILTVKYGR